MKFSFSLLTIVTALLLFGCNGSEEGHFSVHVLVSKELKVFRDDQPTTHSQLSADGNTLYIQSFKGKIYEVDKEGFPDLIFNCSKYLHYDSLASIVLEKKANDSLRMTKGHLKLVRLEGFHVDPNTLWVAPVFNMEKPGTYEGANATYMIPYKLFLGLSFKNFESKTLKNLYDVKSSSIHQRLGKTFTTRLGFSIVDSNIYLRNLVYSENAFKSPEIIQCDFSGPSFDMNCLGTTINYNTLKLKYPITIDRGFFYGESRRFYSGTSGIYDLRYNRTKVFEYAEENTVLTRSTKKSNETMRVSVSSRNNGTTLTYDINDSTFYEHKLRSLSNLYAIDISENLTTWLIYKDSTESKTWLEILELEHL